MKRIKRIAKITTYIFLFLFTSLYALFYWFSSPKSDKTVLKEFQEAGVSVKLLHDQFNDFEFRKIEVVKDTTLPTIVFVHGTIGSILDFKKYIAEFTLSNRANIIAYDRVGYNYKDVNPVQESIAFEKEMLAYVAKDIPKEKLILVGYSYGGPIALAYKHKVDKIILIAPAVYSKVEPMPWMLQLYKWNFTRWLIPPIWKQASKEKLTHPSDLKKFEKKWNENPNEIVVIHGNNDRIVPYSNSLYLEKIFPKEQLKLVTLSGANHGLVWSRFDEVKNILIPFLH